MSLEGKEIVLGVSGGIACYKSLEIVRRIKEGGGNVSVVMTKAAMEFVTPLSFQTLSERVVATSLFSLREESKIGHIKIGENADAMVIAPATANIIGKAANGIADDYLSTIHLACDAPLIIAPAMNHKMWEHTAVQKNIENLKSRGAVIVPPESGFLACGTHATGRMAEPETIIRELHRVIHAGKTDAASDQYPLSGIHVLITAGPTREKIDAVRYITNYSSGKMGYAIAEICRKKGAKVTLVSGPTTIAPPENINLVKVDSADEMYEAVMANADKANLIIKAAAVGDYRVTRPKKQKIKKKEHLELKLAKTKDILKDLGRSKRADQFLVGFAAESQNVENFARKKYKEKNLDLMVANNILEEDAGFGANTNRVLLIDKNGTRELPLLSKTEVAGQLIEAVLSHDRWNEIYSKI